MLDGVSYWSALLNKDQSTVLDGISGCGLVAIQRPELDALWNFYLRARAQQGPETSGLYGIFFLVCQTRDHKDRLSVDFCLSSGSRVPILVKSLVFQLGGGAVCRVPYIGVLILKYILAILEARLFIDSSGDLVDIAGNRGTSTPITSGISVPQISIPSTVRSVGPDDYSGMLVIRRFKETDMLLGQGRSQIGDAMIFLSWNL